MSTRGNISTAIAVRLATITEANGYDIGFKQIFYDKIPMGLQLGKFDLPAIFMIDEGAPYEHEMGCVDVLWALRLQLWFKKDEPDSVLHDGIRAVSKCLFANSPTAQRLDAWRELNPKIHWIELVGDEGDLNMIDANRVATLNLIVHYRTNPLDL